MASLGTLRRALSHRNARIFFGASLTAWTGLWMHRIAVSWLAWELTESAFWVGVVAFCDLAPAVIFSPLAGAVADRADRLRMTMLSQAAIGLNAAVIALLVATGSMTIGVLLVLEVAGGIAASFAQPARQSLMPGLVPRTDLPAAVALNSLTFNVARFIGPALAAPLIAVAGVWPAVAVNALAYAVATATTPMLRVEESQRRGHAATASLFGEMVDGVRYAARHPGLGPILAFSAVGAVLLRGVQEILPPFVERIFGLGPGALAGLTAAFGVGALCAGLMVAARGQLAGTTRLAVLGVGALGLATAGFAATGSFAIGLVCAVLMGAAGSVHGISVQTLAQSASDPSMRGRVLSLWGLITRACPALGALLLGGAGEVFGLRWPTLVAVALSLLVVAWGMAILSRMQAALEGPQADAANR
ncbi:MFS transporter [Neoroseomonas rubea]|uniref:MFS transporter n=1 Tax=Neoroseomonas rubea TaxID=2748666 RepID=UPI0018DF7D6C|nr:MFS transporter [Roseomonas rubea]